MIRNSTANDETKAIMNLVKICFYLYFYLHVVACYWWITINFGTGEQFYRNYDDNNYVSSSLTIFKDEEGNDVPLDPNYDIMFGPHPTFADNSWNRWTKEEDENYEALNANWDNREIIWYMPLDWSNYVDALIYSKFY